MLFTLGTKLQIIFRRPVYLLSDDDEDDTDADESDETAFWPNKFGVRKSRQQNVATEVRKS